MDYAASKGALDTLTIGLANEVADEGIRVNDPVLSAEGLVADLKGSWPAMRTASSPLGAGKSYWCL